MKQPLNTHFVASALLLALAATTACGPAAPSARTQITLQLPQRVDCAAPPSQIKAQLWISSFSQPCDLSTDSNGRVRGECPDVPTRINRDLTLDYYIEDSSAPGQDTPYRLLLTQAFQNNFPLKAPDSETVEVIFTDADFRAASQCLDMTHSNASGEAGADRVTLFAAGGVPCDVDDDGESNLQELCAEPASDPYAP